MELCNELVRLDQSEAESKAVMTESLNITVRLLAPIVPHICHALWQALGNTTDVANEAWPEVDESALVRDEIELVVQVNGKVRAKMSVSVDASKESIEQLALAQDNVQRFIADATVRKIIVVPGRLVNIVAN
jgi:leucyl-tRNA synthetase